MTVRAKIDRTRLFSSTFDRNGEARLALPDFSIILSTNESPVRISFPNAREEDLGGAVRAAASVALAGRSHRPGRAVTAADKISLNGCLTRLMIFGGSDIKFTKTFSRAELSSPMTQSTRRARSVQGLNR
ncbi:MAG: hypothetical protein P4M05_36065 [Bradyrhizobium sp.]|nr:hypothetical protein [Bradyrhizobium sp.]